MAEYSAATITAVQKLAALGRGYRVPPLTPAQRHRLHVDGLAYVVHLDSGDRWHLNDKGRRVAERIG